MRHQNKTRVIRCSLDFAEGRFELPKRRRVDVDMYSPFVRSVRREECGVSRGNDDSEANILDVAGSRDPASVPLLLPR